MGGELGKNIQQWDGYGDLIQTLARWLNRKNPPQGYSVRADTAGDRLRIRLYYSEENIPRLAERMPEISLELSGKESSRTQNGIWEHLQPGIFQCSFPLPHGVMARGAVRIGGSVIPFGPVSQQVDPEWAMPPESGNAFLDLVNRTGGRERMDLPSIFREPRPGTMPPTPSHPAVERLRPPCSGRSVYQDRPASPGKTAAEGYALPAFRRKQSIYLKISFRADCS